MTLPIGLFSIGDCAATGRNNMPAAYPGISYLSLLKAI
jgi:hypothetical protein